VPFLQFAKKDRNQNEEKVYTFEEFKTEFQEYFDMSVGDFPLGTRFWDEFGEYEALYSLTDNESKLLGEWMIITFSLGPSNHYYNFFPNKFFLIDFLSETIQINCAENLFLDKALGTWEITDGIVRVTIHAISIMDIERKSPYNKDVFLIERPYTVDFISIDDIGEEGYTKRPINDSILSEELKKKLRCLNPINQTTCIRELYI
jgi:hypothetical protein